MATAMLVPLHARTSQHPHHRCAAQSMLFSEGDRLAENKAEADTGAALEEQVAVEAVPMAALGRA